MFYEHADETRLLLQDLGQRAFLTLDFDAMQAVGVLVETYLGALEQEDEAVLQRIDAALVDWRVALQHVPLK